MKGLSDTSSFPSPSATCIFSYTSLVSKGKVDKVSELLEHS